jgi:alkylation response protein AidB-like acyl-CoA dehydrogenase
MSIPRHAETLSAILHSATVDEAPAILLSRLIAAGVDQLPLPAAGATLARWQTLAAIGAHDLALAKLFEGHTDALAILQEAGMASAATPGNIFGTWCAEPPDARLNLIAGDGGWVLDGRKSWCSGAHTVTHAVVSCWNENGEALLALVDMRQNGISFNDEGWRAVGMRDSASVDVHFAQVTATPVGAPGFYVARAGFWHGGAGVAACWYGAAARLAAVMQAQLAARPGDAHRLAQLGEISVTLQATAALLRECASGFDRHPLQAAMVAALSVRLAVEAAATKTLNAAGRAFGAGPMCKDAALARLFADLPVFMRQSHAERDLAAVGTELVRSGAAPWTL